MADDERCCLTAVPQLSLGQKAVLTASPDYVSVYLELFTRCRRLIV